ncbi:hypothetical protein ACHAW5_008284 [Stephanodiscus triporus]|uniref:Uncharacterized protein n=1 Tax=Stephanodiscus triporus TaxID=2934178 RepID=A0ABD3MPQ5_9STRA
MKFHFRHQDHHHPHHHRHHNLGGVVVGVNVLPPHADVADLSRPGVVVAPRSSDFRTVAYGGEHRPGEEGGGEATAPLPWAADGGGSSSTSSSSSAEEDEMEEEGAIAPSLAHKRASPTPRRGDDAPTSSRDDEQRRPTPADPLALAQLPRKRFFRLGRRKGRAVSVPTNAGEGSSSSSSGSDDDEPRVVVGGRRAGGGKATASSAAAVAVLPGDPPPHHRRSGIAAALHKPMRMRRAQSLPMWSPSTHPVEAVVPTAAGAIPDGNAVPPVNDDNARLCLSDDDAVVSDARRRCLSDDRDSRSREDRHRRHVTFTSVRIREYSTILGDHPCCPSGPPLSLGWTMEREVHAEFEAYETERVPRRVRSKEELRMDGEERRVILRSLVVGGGVAAAATPSDVDPDRDDPASTSTNVGGGGDGRCGHVRHEGGVGGGESCPVYSQEELRKAERRLTRERACNSRAHRRMNRGFFQPLTAEERERGCIVVSRGDDPLENGGEMATTGEDGDDRLAPMGEPGPGSTVIAEGVRMDVSPIEKPSACHDDTAMEHDEAVQTSSYATS